MKTELALGKRAPDFVINDLEGQTIRLSDYKERKHVILAFLRGFM
jgi:peroxiredoxin